MPSALPETPSARRGLGLSARTEREDGKMANVKRFDDGHSEWECACGAIVSRYRGQGDVSCPECNAQYNAFGQRLRDNWRDNPSVYDDEIGDMEGYEIACARNDF